MTKVMRQGVGDEVELVNGKGDLAIAKIEAIEKKKGKLFIEALQHVPPPLFQLLLAVPWMRPAKLQWVVEKGTELGCSSFLFYRATRSEIGTLTQQDRFHTLAIAALKQSGRLHLPSIEIVSNLSSLLHHETIYFGDPKGSHSTLLPLPSPLLFITGPEAGFAPEEQKLLEEKGRGVRLSPFILRAETAPIAAASIFTFLG